MARVKKTKWYVFEIEDEVYVPPKCFPLMFWMPKLTKRVIKNGVWHDKSEVLYPGYVFVSVHRSVLSDDWFFIESILDIELLRVDGKPYVLSRDDIAKIRQRESVEVIIDTMEFERGQKVRVRFDSDSPYSGMVGKFLRTVPITGGKYARVVFDLYGVRRRIEQIPIDYLDTYWRGRQWGD